MTKDLLDEEIENSPAVVALRRELVRIEEPLVISEKKVERFLLKVKDVIEKRLEIRRQVEKYPDSDIIEPTKLVITFISNPHGLLWEIETKTLNLSYEGKSYGPPFIVNGRLMKKNLSFHTPVLRGLIERWVDGFYLDH